MVLEAIWDFSGPKAIYSAPTHDAPKVQSGLYSIPDPHWYHTPIYGKSNNHEVMEKLLLWPTGVLVYEMIPHERLKSSRMVIRDYKEHQTLAHVDTQW